MQFLDSSVQVKKKKKKTRQAEIGPVHCSFHICSVTATSEPLHPPLPPGGRIAGEGERRKRAEFVPDPPSDRFWPSGWPHRNQKYGEIRASWG
ncbi:hypothetical protein NDU88_010264 [Pleurodeles waltl]|uniref:Uncharacterized protein n=1 Tax=Pleurodeles waltl TaxID=8319 RepID=A0AAV7QWW0_PLEWA|nr:hypothetical protein NDU88_010264 [Pleurodeles waltl]